MFLSQSIPESLFYSSRICFGRFSFSTVLCNFRRSYSHSENICSYRNFDMAGVRLLFFTKRMEQQNFEAVISKDLTLSDARNSSMKEGLVFL